MKQNSSHSNDEAQGIDESEKRSSEEFGGPKGLEPTRYGDWQTNGRVSDF